MRWMSRMVAMGVVLSLSLVSDAFAQRREVTGFRPLARGSAKLAAQQPAVTTAGPTWSLAAGIASGDDEYDLGIALGGSARWRRSDWPVTARGDAYFAHHSGDFAAVFGGVDVSVNLFALLGSAEYSFPTESSFSPYVFGGLGVAYASVNVDFEGDLEGTDFDSEIDLAFGVGGGVKFTPWFGVELRLMDAGGFTTIPVLAVFHF